MSHRWLLGQNAKTYKTFLQSENKLELQEILNFAIWKNWEIEKFAFLKNLLLKPLVHKKYMNENMYDFLRQKPEKSDVKVNTLVELAKVQKQVLAKKLDIEGAIASSRLVHLHDHQIYNYFPSDISNHKFLSSWASKYLPCISPSRRTENEKITVCDFLDRARETLVEKLGPKARKLDRKKMQIWDKGNNINFCHLCGSRGHNIKTCFWTSDQNANCYGESYQKAMFDFLNKLERVPEIVHPEGIEFKTKILRDHIRFSLLDKWFWHKFDDFCMIKHGRRYRPESLTFSALDKAIAAWWALGAHMQILKVIVLGYQIRFSADPPMEYTTHKVTNIINESFEKKDPDKILRDLNEKNRDNKEELDKLLTQDVKEGKMFFANERQFHFISPAFLQVGLDKTRRILDASALNVYIPRYKKTLPTISTILANIQEGDVVLTIDLKGAYSQIRIHPTCIKFLGVEGGNHIYGYHTLPFGLRSAVYIFTIMLEPLKYYLAKYFKIYIYIDDMFIILGNKYKHTRVEIQYNKNFVFSVIHRLALRLNQKTNTAPMSQFSYIGWTLDSLESLIKPRETFYIKIYPLLEFIERKQKLKLKPCRKIVGLCAHLGQLLPIARILMKIFSVKIADFGGSETLELDITTKEREVIRHLTTVLLQTHRGFEIVTTNTYGTFVVSDTSEEATGAYIYHQGQTLIPKVYELPVEFKQMCSTYRELYGIIFFTLVNLDYITRLLNAQNKRVIYLIVDNQSSITIFNQKGCNEILIQALLAELIHRIPDNFQLKLNWSRRDCNVVRLADNLSKYLKMDKNFVGWKPEFIKKFLKKFGKNEIYEQFCQTRELWKKRFYDKMIYEMNQKKVFFLPHERHNIGKIVLFLQMRKARGWVVAPYFPSKPWFLTLRENSTKILGPFRWKQALENTAMRMGYYKGIIFEVNF